MQFKKFASLIPIFILGVLLIAVYRTFDNLSVLVDWGSRLISLLVPFFIGGIIAYLLLPPCKFFEKLYCSSKLKFVANRGRGFSILTVYAIVIALIAVLLRIVIPTIAQSIDEFASQWPVLYARFQLFVIRLGFFDTNEVTQFFSADNITNHLMNFMNLENVMGFTQGLIGVSLAVLSLFIGLALSIYILLDRDSLYKLVHRIAHLFIKPKILNPLVKYTRKINEFLYRYIYCQLLDSLIMGVLSFVGLSVIGVSHAPVSALILGIFNFVPYFGSIVATIIAVLLALFSDGLNTAIAVTIFLLILQQTDANVIQPRLAGAYLKVRPFWIILGIVIGGGYFGLWGMFLAPPVVAAIKIITNDILDHREKRLDKNVEEKAGEKSDE